MGVSAKDDSDKLRGKRGYILLEEFGNFPLFLTSMMLLENEWRMEAALHLP